MNVSQTWSKFYLIYYVFLAEISVAHQVNEYVCRDFASSLWMQGREETWNYCQETPLEELGKIISDTDKKLRTLTSNVRMHFAHWLAANVNHFVVHHAYDKDVY